MIDNNIIFKNKKAKDIKSFLGISGENEQERLVFSFADGFVDGICNLEVEFPDGYKFAIEELEKDVENECYRLIVQSGLLTQEGWLKMQLKIIQETEIWKCFTFKMFVEHAIKASESIEKQYPNFVEITKIKTRELEQGFKQIVDKTNKTVEDLNQSKENIKANTESIKKLQEDVETNTENMQEANKNISDLKEKLDNLDTYDDTEIKSSISDLEKNKADKTELSSFVTKYVNNKIGDIDIILSNIADESEAI